MCANGKPGRRDSGQLLARLASHRKDARGRCRRTLQSIQPTRPSIPGLHLLRLLVFGEAAAQLAHEQLVEDGLARRQSPRIDVGLVEETAEMGTRLGLADRHLDQIAFGRTPGAEAPVDYAGDLPAAFAMGSDEEIPEVRVAVKQTGRLGGGVDFDAANHRERVGLQLNGVQGGERAPEFDADPREVGATVG